MAQVLAPEIRQIYEPNLVVHVPMHMLKGVYIHISNESRYLTMSEHLECDVFNVTRTVDDS